MKNQKFIYAAIAVMAFLFTFGIVSAATTWSGDNTFTGTVNWFQKGIKIGQQGSGGVTFFNGTIVNQTTTDGVDNPVAFGDNVRIDGEIWRTERGGDNPLKLSDSIRPTTTNAYSLGESGYQFKDGYFGGTVNVDTLTASHVNTGDFTASGTVSVGGNLAATGNATIQGNADVTGNVIADSNFLQGDDSYGAIKAAVSYSHPFTISNFGYNVTPARIGSGNFNMTFDHKVNTRYYDINAVTSKSVFCNATSDGSNEYNVNVRCFISSTGGAIDVPFQLLVY